MLYDCWGNCRIALPFSLWDSEGIVRNETRNKAIKAVLPFSLWDSTFDICCYFYYDRVAVLLMRFKGTELGQKLQEKLLPFSLWDSWFPRPISSATSSFSSCRSPYEIRGYRIPSLRKPYALPFSLWDSKKSRGGKGIACEIYVAVLLMRFWVKMN